MKIIRKLSERITEEIEDAKHYAQCALKYRKDHRSLADTMFQISQEEVRHADMIHEEVVKIINEYRATNGEPPAIMLQLYDYMHQKSIASMNEVKVLQQMYQ